MTRGELACFSRGLPAGGETFDDTTQEVADSTAVPAAACHLVVISGDAARPAGDAH